LSSSSWIIPIDFHEFRKSVQRIYQKPADGPDIPWILVDTTDFGAVKRAYFHHVHIPHPADTLEHDLKHIARQIQL